MGRALLGGTIYFGIVFAVGFVLGIVRTQLLEPQLGVLRAVILEAPLMLVASWAACGWAIRRCAVPRSLDARSTMGLAAFLLLMAAEIALGALFGRSLAEQWAALGSPAGLLGFGAQVAFGLFPVFRLRPSRSSHD